MEELAGLALQRRAAGHDEAQPPAEARPHLREHQAVVEPLAPAGRRQRCRVRIGLADARHGAGQRVPEQPAPRRRRFGDRGQHARLQLLAHARDDGHQCRRRGPQVARDRVEVLGEDDREAGHQVGVDHRPFEGVAQRQERQRDVVRRQPEDRDHRFGVRHDVAVRQHHALGLARRAGGVDDGGERFGADRGAAGLDGRPDRRVDRQPLAAAREERGAGDDRRAQAEVTGLRITGVRRRPRVDDDHQLQRRQQVSHLLHLRRLDAIRDDGDAGAGVGEDVPDLRRRQRRIDRHGDDADRLRREIDQDPLGPALGHDRQPVAGGKAGRQQAGGALLDRLDQVGGRPVAKASLAAAAHQRRPRTAGRDARRQIGERRHQLRPRCLLAAALSRAAAGRPLSVRPAIRGAGRAAASARGRRLFAARALAGVRR